MAGKKNDLQGPSPGSSGSTASPQREKFWRDTFQIALTSFFARADPVTLPSSAKFAVRIAAGVADEALAELAGRFPLNPPSDSNSEGSQGGK